MSSTGNDPDGRSEPNLSTGTRLGPLGEILVPFLESDQPQFADQSLKAGGSGRADASAWELRFRSLVVATAHAMAHVWRAPLALAAILVDHGTSLAMSLTEPETAEPAVPHAVCLANTPESSLAAWTLKAAQCVVVADLAEETRFDDRFLKQLGGVSALAAPFFVRGLSGGVVGAADTRPGRFSRSQAQLAAEVAASLGRLLARLLDPPGGWREEAAGFGGVADWNREKRSSTRQRFEWAQRMAPVRQGRLPQPDAFLSVQCRDLSGSGISFYWNGPPDFSELVVALGTPPRLTFVLSRVVWFAPVAGSGRTAFLVGCRFLRRVNL